MQKSLELKIVTQLLPWAVLVSIALSLLVFGAEVSHDFSSWLVQSKSAVEGLSPYGTFLDIKPPGLILSTSVWIFLFGGSDLSFFTLQTVLTFFSLVGVVLLAPGSKKQRIWWAAIFTTISFLSGAYSLMPLSPELFALPFVTIGTYLFFKARERPSLLGIGAALFSIASTFKESFIPILLVPLLLAIGRRSGKLGFVVFLWSASIQLIPYLALFIKGWFEDYWEAISIKSQIFSITVDSLGMSLLRTAGTSILYVGPFALILSLSVLLLSILRTLREPSWEYLSSERCVTVLLFLGLLLGLVLQQKPLNGHYALLIYLSVWLLAAQFWSLRQNWRQATLIAIGLLVPGISFYNQASQSLALGNEVIGTGSFFYTEGPVERASKEILRIASQDSCLHVAHGWRAGAYYHYANLPPCSRHYLANLTILSNSSLEELAEDIQSSRKYAIILEEKSSADLNSNELRMIHKAIALTDFDCIQDLGNSYVRRTSCE